jgi:hypothetical protein
MKRLIFLLLLAALGVTPANADQTITLKAGAGLDGLCRPGRWTPIRVDVDARGQAGGEVASGEIIVEWGDARVHRAISVASPSHKQVELYIRTADARDSMKVRLLIDGREIAATEAAVRLVAPADALTVCVASANTWSASGVTCSTTLNPDALPRSWRGYGAADDVVWESGSRPRLSGEQRTALNQWRAVQAIENAETPSPSIAAITPGARALRRTGTAMLLYAAALGFFVWPLSRIRSRSLAVYPAIVALVAAGSVVAIASGRIGPGASVHVSQSAVVEQVWGMKGSFVVARAIAEFPAFGTFALRAPRVDGAMALRAGGDRRDLRFDENGAPVLAGIYGLGATAAFEVEAVSAFEALDATFRGTTVRVANTSTQELRDCRFGAGFSKLIVGTLSPGQYVEAERQSGLDSPVFSCKLDAAVVEFAESHRSIDSDGTAVIMLRLPERQAAP